MVTTLIPSRVLILTPFRDPFYIPFRDFCISPSSFSVKVILSLIPTSYLDLRLELVLALVEDNGNSTLALNIYPKSLFSLSPAVIIEFSLYVL